MKEIREDINNQVVKLDLSYWNCIFPNIELFIDIVIEEDVWDRVKEFDWEPDERYF